ncbi:4Fe-4S ferredoxin [Denitrobacterium detoxificans]|uniref:Formate dehydrogenase iron-sulfur subunit n=1 Tax=Denitrobacterium detoxificans TaxID=79604 RepID=A0A172RWV5_9ACTN|nr:4Fe-4S dicluster domain-containing protein [Denitrobacterium detoxificans]ANE22206.1 4Fe-4S ferredoxin [Denitrobacterium detoxificans]SEO65322.1 formate dehydrogenase iron-sulfur subunit [Denitrobacterium detoxificans]
MSDKAILFDSSKCTGCKGCQVACKTWNNLPSSLEYNAGEFTGSLQNPIDLNGTTRRIVTYNEADNGKKYGVNWAFGQRACMHCDNPSCVSVCPSGCLSVDESTGFVTVDEDKCIGCQYCRSACPFDVPRHTGVNVVGGGIVVNKCTGCVDRIKQGRQPACVTTCQPGALQFGDRDEMLAIAHERVEKLKAKGFADARVYGETEVGGTHQIMVLKYPISQYELPENPERNGLVDALGFMKPLTGVGAAALVAGLGLSFLTGVGYKRHEMRYDEKAHDVIDVETGEVIKHIDKEAGER